MNMLINSKRLYSILATVLVSMTFGFVADAFSPTSYETESKLSTGRWVKIKVTETGIQEITHEQLAAMGFTEPENVSVYGYGGVYLGNEFSVSHPGDLPVQPVYRFGDKLLFYGESDLRVDLAKDVTTATIKRNTYSTAGYYFLSDITPGASKEPTLFSYNSSASETRKSHSSIQLIEEEVTCPGLAGARFLGPNFKYTPNQELKFIAVDPDTTELETNSDAVITGRFRYSWAGKAINEVSIAFETNDLSIIEEVNRKVPAVSSSSKLYYNYKDGSMDIGLKTKGDSSYVFKPVMTSNATLEFGAIDYATFAYTRYNNLRDLAQLRMVFSSVTSSVAFALSGANENVKIWNVTSPVNVFGYRTMYDSETGVMKGTFETRYTPSNNGHAYLIAFDPSKPQHKVEYAGEVANQNIHSNSSPDMLIITTKTMRKYAEQLAQAHRDYQGHKVYVYTQDEIFNEFSSGTPTAMAYRRAAKLFFDRNSSRFRYLLLYGAGSFDNRGLTYDIGDKLLTFQCESLTEANDESRSYCADSYFGMLQDGYIHSTIYYANMDIAVSRIPVEREDHAESVNRKIINYLKNPPVNASMNRALLMCDNGDNNAHMKQAEQVDSLIKAVAPHVTVTKAYCALYPWTSTMQAESSHDAAVNALASGQKYMFYTGHGGPSRFTGEDLWTMAHVEESNYNIPPISYFASCNVLTFDRGDNSIAEAMLYKETGGSIAVISAGRSVYRECNQILSRAVSEAMFTESAGDATGDIYRVARNNAIKWSYDNKERGYGVNTLCYNMIGDPALPLCVPTCKVATTHINSAAIADSDTIQVYPLENNVIQGAIVDANGVELADFNGTITLTLYESPVEVYTHTQGGDEAMPIIREEDMLVEIVAPVENGKFSARLNIPVPTRPDDINRITYYAVTDDKTRSANGLFDRIVVMDYNSEHSTGDTVAPQISEMYIDGRTFENGDYIGADGVLYATILADESGLCKSTISIGTATKLILDGSKSYPEVKGMLVTDTEGVTTLQFPFSGMTDGYHTFMLSIADNAGNRTERSISFYVINKSVTASMQVEESPAREKASIAITHNFNEEPVGRLVIEDMAGNTVFTRENCSFPYEWDLKDSNGEPVEDGTYNCFAILNAQKQYSSTPKVKIIVIKQ